MIEDRDLLDDVLDRALALQGRAEPRPGLELRVLASLRSRPPLPRWRALLSSRPAWVAAGILGAAGGLAALFLLDTPRPGKGANPPLAAVPGPTAPARTVSTTAPPAVPAVAETRNSPSPRRPATRLASAPRVPRRASFPERLPLSEQELLLLRYVATTPPEESAPRAGFLDEPAPLPALPDATTNS